MVRLLGYVAGDGRTGRVAWPELDRIVVCLLLGTGLRASELVGLNLGAYEAAEGDAFVQVGKGAKPRTVLAAPIHRLRGRP